MKYCNTLSYCENMIAEAYEICSFELILQNLFYEYALQR